MGMAVDYQGNQNWWMESVVNRIEKKKPVASVNNVIQGYNKTRNRLNIYKSSYAPVLESPMSFLGEYIFANATDL
jgi:hypothetical protein